MKRRTFLQSTLAAGAVVATSTGLLTPGAVRAAEDANPFEATSLDDALKALAVTPEENPDRIKIKAPEIAENGAVVPITIATDIEDATEILLLVANNPTPLAAVFKLGEGAIAGAATRIKMGKTSDVIAVVKAGDKTYSAKTEVKVTIGGCGG
ncbi:MAG: thiosulfate oxidation carrier protein SoxY [Thiolinea sp.]